jgi:hypothetical protein
MWGFLGKATRQMEDLNDDVNAADTLFTEVVRYFGEDDKNMSSTEFYGIFKTFVTSYRVRASRAHRSKFLTMVGNRNSSWKIERPRRRGSRLRGEGKLLRMRRQIGGRQKMMPSRKKPRRQPHWITCSRSCETATTSDDAPVVRVPAPSARKR